VCFARVDIPRLLLRFIVSNIYDKMDPNSYFSLNKIMTAENGALAVSVDIPFEKIEIENASRRS
jgi:hypothetical protein